MYGSGVCVGVQIFGVNAKHRFLGTEEQELLYYLYSESAYEDTRCPQGGALVTLMSLPADLKGHPLNGHIVIGNLDVELMWARCAPFIVTVKY